MELLWNGPTKKFVDVRYRHCRLVLPSHMIGENITISKIQSGTTTTDHFVPAMSIRQHNSQQEQEQNNTKQQ